MEPNFQDLGISPCDILLPQKWVDMTRWAVIACDQYTSQQSYWDEAEALVGDAPSTLRMIVPEIYLDMPKAGALQSQAVKVMEDYMRRGLFRRLESSFIYLERATPYAPLRRGLVVAMDLEQYDYNAGSQTLIRATEGTILKRLPPRMEVRRRALLECPHIMILIDDPEGLVIEKTAQYKAACAVEYDFDLMAGAGHVTGYRVHNDAIFDQIARSLRKLKDRGGMLYAMGDGNHSLATAKACWEELKKTLPPEQRENHPARYALAELVNLHDEGLHFHPIHRVLFGVPEDFQARLCAQMGAREGTGGKHTFLSIHNGRETLLSVDNPQNPIDVGTLQDALDAMLEKMPGARIDYVHGESAVRELAARPGNAGILLNAMDKYSLFPAVEQLGTLPRKTFSMGEAPEKRFYLECRAIR